MAPAQLRMAKLALSMHTASPAVRMFDEIAIQNGAKEVPCGTFIAIASRKVCDNDALKDILKSQHALDVVSTQFLYNIQYSSLPTLYVLSELKKKSLLVILFQSLVNIINLHLPK